MIMLRKIVAIFNIFVTIQNYKALLIKHCFESDSRAGIGWRVSCATAFLSNPWPIANLPVIQ